MRAVVVKCHHESTVGRAAAATEATGLPRARRASCSTTGSAASSPRSSTRRSRLGARIVWWPTLSSPAHRGVFGRQRRRPSRHSTTRARTICRLVADHGAVIATGHAGRATVHAPRRARRRGGRPPARHPRRLPRPGSLARGAGGARADVPRPLVRALRLHVPARGAAPASGRPRRRGDPRHGGPGAQRRLVRPRPARAAAVPGRPRRLRTRARRARPARGGRP